MNQGPRLRWQTAGRSKRRTTTVSTYLLIDIGAGTMDLLFWDEASPLNYKAVVRSPVPYLADAISSCPGDLLITGREMGGGSVTAVLKKRAQEHRVVISEKASATLHHDRERIAAWGIDVVREEAAQKMITTGQFNHFVTADIDAQRLKKIVNGLGKPFEFDVVGICAQDHGVPPEGVSHLDYRHRLFTAVLDNNPHAHALLYPKDAVPPTMNRLRSIAESAGRLPAKEIFVMDSGMAAIQGVALDHLAVDKTCIAVLDVATSHTLGATLVNDEIAGFFEYHTSEINGARWINCSRIWQTAG
jgi:uncharacterized protein (DUF1786 family)